LKKVKIFGAGSIGNHLANASRSLGWSVDICDVDPEALARTRNEIYPARYGQWDESIRLFESSAVPKGDYDLIIVGTPPEHHIPLAMEAIAEKPHAILVEKPFCTPDLAGAQQLVEAARKSNVAVFTGYDHVVGMASEKMSEIIRSNSIGKIQTLDVEFREFWGGIFAAHPWLDGPADSYLGYWKRGGGASGEHSHALNLWQHYAHEAGAGRVSEVSAMMEFVSDGRLDYDQLCSFHLKTENGLIGRVIQDVVTNPPRKWARAQGADGYAEWHCGFEPGVDAVFLGTSQDQKEDYKFQKTRPDDFIQELRHIEQALNDEPSRSPISMERGMETMLIVAAAHKSLQEARTVAIDYNQGFSSAALL
jgi:predicted dehydrogenase